MLRIPYCLGNRLTFGVKVVSVAHRPHSTLQKHYFSPSVTNFCKRLNKPRCLLWLEGLRQLKKLIHLIGSRTRDLVRLLNENSVNYFLQNLN
jgi:hypothetical protein